MYEAELKYVKKRLIKLHKKEKLRNKKICLFGVSDNTRQIIKILREFGYEPVFIIDNDSLKWGSYCSKIQVQSVDSIVDVENLVVLVYSFFWKEMQLQLETNGFDIQNIYILVGRERTVCERVLESYRGKIIYQRLRRKYGNYPVFLCPYTGTGDIYLIGTFWNQFIEQNNIKDYIFCVISNACKKVAMMFGIKNIVLLHNQKDSEYLIRYYALCPNEIELTILNDGWAQIHTNPSEWLRGYKGLYFTDLFRQFVFHLPDTCCPVHPELNTAEREISELFEAHNLQRGKTVILSPYSNTLADLPDTFWTDLADKLKAKGYIVCTNSSGDTEPPVPNTKPFFFPLNIAPQVLNEAGFFIGIRSGFCDVISGSKAKKIILYDSGNRFYNCSAYEYFSLNAMGLSDDAIEIEFDGNHKRKVIDTILKYF